MDVDPDLVSRAIIVWTGWKQPAWPQRVEERLMRQLGSNIALEIIPLLRQLEDKFYPSDARDHAADLKEMGDVASAEFGNKHLEVSEDAIRQAFAWCYTFDYK